MYLHVNTFTEIRKSKEIIKSQKSELLNITISEEKAIYVVLSKTTNGRWEKGFKVPSRLRFFQQ